MQECSPQHFFKYIKKRKQSECPFLWDLVNKSFQRFTKEYSEAIGKKSQICVNWQEKMPKISRLINKQVSKTQK